MSVNINYSFDDAVESWSAVPVEGLGNLSSNHLLGLSDIKFTRLVQQTAWARYNELFLNYEERTVRVMGYRRTLEKEILDFGSGFGIDAREFLLHGKNKVSISDISALNIDVAKRTVATVGKESGAYIIIDSYPYIETDKKFDVIHCSGVLHHIPWAGDILSRFSELLKPDGEIRLMLYSEHAWRHHIGTNPRKDPSYGQHLKQFMRLMDPVGNYCTWYDLESLVNILPEKLKIEHWEHATPNRQHALAILEKKR